MALIMAVLAYLVSQRGHEVGVRMALGATRADVVRLVVGASMAALGILVGLAGAAAVSGLLYGVSPTDTRFYAGVAGGLAAVALAATAIPAWRAACLDPVASLKAE